ncbi:MAG: hypothetical protein IKN59_09310 [Paludibacteraceae bacterium]|nr:hypothetical protein [Paludibacteraceae bacterium]
MNKKHFLLLFVALSLRVGEVNATLPQTTSLATETIAIVSNTSVFSVDEQGVIFQIQGKNDGDWGTSDRKNYLNEGGYITLSWTGNFYDLTIKTISFKVKGDQPSLIGSHYQCVTLTTDDQTPFSQQIDVSNSYTTYTSNDISHACTSVSFTFSHNTWGTQKCYIENMSITYTGTLPTFDIESSVSGTDGGGTVKTSFSSIDTDEAFTAAGTSAEITVDGDKLGTGSKGTATAYFRAIPSDGYYFEGWYANSSDAASGTNKISDNSSYSVTINNSNLSDAEEYTLYANFVDKQVPTFTWNVSEEVNANTSTTDVFETDNDETSYVISSSDPTVAEVVDNTLYTYKAGSVTFTVTQAGNANWFAKTEYYDLTVNAGVASEFKGETPAAGWYYLYNTDYGFVYGSVNKVNTSGDARYFKTTPDPKEATCFYISAATSGNIGFYNGNTMVYMITNAQPASSGASPYYYKIGDATNGYYITIYSDDSFSDKNDNGKRYFNAEGKYSTCNFPKGNSGNKNKWLFISQAQMEAYEAYKSVLALRNGSINSSVKAQLTTALIANDFPNSTSYSSIASNLNGMLTDKSAKLANGNDDWSRIGDVQNANTVNFNGLTMVERYYGSHYSGDVTTQTISNLPNGYYELQIYVQAHNANISKAGGTSAGNVYTKLIVNGVEQGIPMVDNKSATSEEPTLYRMVVPVTDGNLNIKITNTQQGANWITFLTRDLKYLSEVSYTVKTNKDGWATFCSPYNTEVPSGATLYIATVQEENYIRVSPSEETILNAGEGALIKGEANSSYTFTATTDAGDGLSDNILNGTIAPISRDEEVSTYVLSTKNNTVDAAFFLYVGSTIAENKAYFTAPESSAPSIRINTEENNTTDLTNTDKPSTLNRNLPMYNILGMPVSGDYKGLVIQNGNKFYVQ